jgi:NAD(P)-dependent dehydrogenase (short-subunit alcohol dehydrogenase family)
MAMNDLTGKWALVTGSSRGIGQQIALGLAEHGCNIIVHGRKLKNTLATMQLLEKFSVDTFAVAGELGNELEENAMLDSILERIDCIDILYNNAAIMASWHEDILETPMDEWSAVLEINFFSMVRVCNRLVPLMKNQNWGRVINLSTGMKDTPQLMPYSVSKAAVDKYSLELAYALKDRNVLVNTLDPGWCRTDLGGEYAENEVESVLPGALEPALLSDGSVCGQTFFAQDFK